MILKYSFRLIDGRGAQLLSDAISALENGFLDQVRTLAPEFGSDVTKVVDAEPWSIDAIGPPIKNTKHLAQINTAVVEDGRLRSLTVDGEEVHWINESSLQETFLAALKAKGGQGWSDLVSALEMMWRCTPSYSQADIDAVHAMRASRFVDSIFFVNARDMQKRSPETWEEECDFFDSDHAVVTKHIRNLARHAEDRLWHSAFADGRILVFSDHPPNGSIFEAPHVWHKSPPFKCKALEAARKEFEDRRREIFERSTIGKKFSRFGAGLRCTEYDSAPSALGRRGSWRFLLSKDVATFIDSTSAIPLATRRGRSSYDEQDRPIVEDVISKLNSREMQKVKPYVEQLYDENPDIFAGDGTRDSKIRRICRRVKEARKPCD